MIIKWNAVEVYIEVWKFLEKNEHKQIHCFISTKETKEIRTLAQNRTFYKLFTDIGNHLWETPEDIKEILLKWIFWVRVIKMWNFESEQAIEKHTSKLDIVQGKEFIDKTLAFVKKYNMPITIESKELKSLYDSYK